MGEVRQELERLLQGHTKNLENVIRAVQYAQDVAVALEQQQQQQQQRQLAAQGNTVDELTRSVEKLVLQEAELRFRIEALKRLQQANLEGADVKWKDELEQQLTQVRGNFDPERHKKESELFKQFRRSVWAVNHPGEPLPDEENDEVVMLTTQSEVVDRCPLTQLPFEEPVKNRHCTHSYSKEAIVNYVRLHMRRGHVTCPIAGCGNEVTMDSLEPNIQLQVQLQHLRRQQARRKEDSSVEFTAVE